MVCICMHFHHESHFVSSVVFLTIMALKRPAASAKRINAKRPAVDTPASEGKNMLTEQVNSMLSKLSRTH